MPVEPHLPHWAQRANPLVRRNLTTAASRDNLDLGRHWRLLRAAGLTTIGSLALGLLEGLNLASLPVTLALAPVYVSVYAWLLGAFFSYPVLVVLYGRFLVQVSAGAAGSILRERAEDRLDLLRTIPASLREILLSQSAASIWNNLAGLDTLLWIAGLLSVPIVVISHATLWFSNVPAIPQRLIMLTGLGATFLRPWLELVMAGALGTLTGSLARYRLSAGASAALLLATYFVLVNLPRLLPMEPLARFMVEIVVPLALPLLVTWGALTLAERTLT